MPPFKKSHWILLFATAVAINACTSQAATDKSPWLNSSLSIPERVDLLVAQMTLEEKIGQMMHQAPAIPRLGIPEYNWWSEGLHGVARAGLATVFPQAIGLGDEVVQVYLSLKNGVPGAPLRTLAGYKRVHMQPGELKTVNIMVRPYAFATFSEGGKREIRPGNFEISVGGGQPGIKVKTSSNILQTSVTIMK